MSRRSTKGWNKESDGKYSNRETSMIAEVLQNPSYSPSSGRKKWVAQVAYDTHAGLYVVKSSKFKKKSDAKDYILDYIDVHESPKVTCGSCGSTSLGFGGKDEGRRVRKVWYDCTDCGYEGQSRFAYE